jgi:hypothetical protein
LNFDASRRQFKDDREANKMLRGEYRAPFTIPDLST